MGDAATSPFHRFAVSPFHSHVIHNQAMNSMNNPPQYLAPGQDVLVIGRDKKPHRAKIIEVYSPEAARVESLDGKHSAIAAYSESGEVNTFYFAPASAKAEQPKEASKKT